MKTRILAPLALVAASALILTGCVDNSNQTQPSATPSSTAISTSKDDALAAQVPAAITKRGTLLVASDTTYAPNEFKDDSGQITGWGSELIRLIALKLGLKAEITTSVFDNIIPSVAGGKFDVGASSFTDTVEREKQLDFVHYYDAGFMWAAGAGKSVDPENPCGLKVAVQTGSYEETDEIPAKNKKCTDAGKPAIQVQKFDSQQDVNNAVILGKADALSADSPVTLYAIAQSKGKLVAAGKIFDVAPYGLAIAKNSALTPLVQKALQSLIDDGTYGKLLTQWGVQDGAVKTADINAAAKG